MSISPKFNSYVFSHVEYCDILSISSKFQGSKIVLIRSYLRVSRAAGQVNILIFLLKIKFSPCMPINFVMQGKCLFSDISRPEFNIYSFSNVYYLPVSVNSLNQDQEKTLV